MEFTTNLMSVLESLGCETMDLMGVQRALMKRYIQILDDPRAYLHRYVIAAIRGHNLPLLRMLEDHGGNLRDRDVILSSVSSSMDIFRYVRNYVRNSDIDNTATELTIDDEVLITAIREDRHEIVELCLKSRKYAEHIIFKVLLIAASMGNDRIIDFMRSESHAYESYFNAVNNIPRSASILSQWEFLINNNRAISYHALWIKRDACSFALRYAALQGHTKIVNCLIDYGIDVIDWIALYFAAYNGNKDIVDMIVKFMRSASRYPIDAIRGDMGERGYYAHALQRARPAAEIRGHDEIAMLLADEIRKLEDEGDHD